VRWGCRARWRRGPAAAARTPAAACRQRRGCGGGAAGSDGSRQGGRVGAGAAAAAAQGFKRGLDAGLQTISSSQRISSGQRGRGGGRAGRGLGRQAQQPGAGLTSALGRPASAPPPEQASAPASRCAGG
jgi:hypothetical protein